VDILKRATAFREGDPVNCYPFIEAERTQRHNFKRACELIKFSRFPPLRIARRSTFTASLAMPANPAVRDVASEPPTVRRRLCNVHASRVAVFHEIVTGAR
jgi:hypothetical protein